MRPSDHNRRWWEKTAESCGFCCLSMARRFGVSLRQLERQFKQVFKCSPRKWISRLRLRIAKKLLKQNQPIKNIAWQLGYKHASNFSAAFKKQSGSSPAHFNLPNPSQYRSRND